MTDEQLLQWYPALRFFTYDHLPEYLQTVSEPLCEMAWTMARTLPYDTETSTGLRKLLEAKDAFVRASIESGHE